MQGASGLGDRDERLLRLALHNGLVSGPEAFELASRAAAGPPVRELLVQQRFATGDEVEALEDLLASLVRRELLAALPALPSRTDTVVSGAGAPAGEPATGGRLGPYELHEELGRGGMAVVYRARHAGLQHDVALKVMRPGLESDLSTMARFRLEAQAAAAMAGHPNIVAARDVGEADGKVYFAMDLVQGRSLESLVAEGEIAPAQAAGYVAEAARAIHYAHTQGILHRDVKPGNILVTPGGTVRLTDFGLAKLTTATEADMTALTRAGAVLGTPSYMSPEQARGAPLDARADVYGLGATLWHALAGVQPFAGDSVEAIISKVADEELPPPRSRNAEVPRDLDVITMRCLEKDPAQRYQTAADLAEDLDRFVRGDAIAARAPGAWERFRRRVRKHPRGWAGAAVAVLAVLALGATLAWRSAEAGRMMRRDLERARLLIRTDPAEAIGILEGVRERAPDWPGLDAALAAARNRVGALELQKRRSQAAAALDSARTANAEFDRLTQALADLPSLRAEADRTELAGTVDDPAVERERLWQERERAYVVAWAGYQSVRKLLHGEVGAPEQAEATAKLGRMARARLLEAEREGDRAAAARFESELRALDLPADRTFLDGAGSLSLDSDPSGAVVECFAYVERDGRLVAAPRAAPGPTPLRDLPLPRGSYLLVLRAPGRVPVRYPVRLGRGEHRRVADPVPLPTAEQIGPDYVYVPPGRSIVGGDPQAYRSRLRAQVRVAGFCITRFEIAFQDYLRFLRGLLAERVPDAEVARHCPRESDRTPYWTVQGGRIRSLMRNLPMDLPVFGISNVDARRYCEWRSRLEGRPVRLPTENEWERAARGADGRWFPWGFGFRWGWTIGGRGRNKGGFSIKPCGTRPEDESPFGVRDMGGSLEEFTGDRPEGWGALYADHGGSWNVHSVRRFRAASRFANDERNVAMSVGFRVVAELKR